MAAINPDKNAPEEGAAEKPFPDVETGEVKSTTIVSKAYDIGAKYAGYFNDHEVYSPEEEKRLRWKFDYRIMPFLWFNIILGATDKVSSSTGALYGMLEDTNTDVGNRYSWVGSAFYFGYLFWCFPAASLLQKLPIAKLMCGCIFSWGVVLLGTAYVNSFPALIALRVLLGFLEAPIIPGGYLMLSMWYTRHEQSLRTGFMYTNWSTILIIGPVGYAIGAIGGEHQWRYWFIFLGSLSMAYSLLLGWLLPDNVVRAKFIKEREKAVAVERLRADQTGMENKTFKKEQFVEALLDPKTWLMFFFNVFVSIPNGALTNFQALIIKGIGFSSREALLLSMPEGAVANISTYGCSLLVWYLGKRFPNAQVRVGVIVTGELIGIIGAILTYVLPLDNIPGRLIGLWMAKFFLGPYIISLELNIANISGHTKKTTVQALIFMAYCISNIIAPQFFKSDQAPLYPLGMGAMLGAYALAIITIITYAAYCYFENCRRARIDGTRDHRVHVDTDFKDLTDRENKHFKYVW